MKKNKKITLIICSIVFVTLLSIFIHKYYIIGLILNKEQEIALNKTTYKYEDLTNNSEIIRSGDIRLKKSNLIPDIRFYTIFSKNEIYVVNDLDNTYQVTEIGVIGDECFPLEYLDRENSRLKLCFDLKVKEEVKNNIKCYHIIEKNTSNEYWINKENFYPVEYFFDESNIVLDFDTDENVTLPELDNYTLKEV